MTSWTVACQALLSMEFSRQEYWGGLPFPSPNGEIGFLKERNQNVEKSESQAKQTPLDLEA